MVRDGSMSLSGDMFSCVHIRALIDFWVTVCKTVRPMLSHHCLSVCLSCPGCL